MFKNDPYPPKSAAATLRGVTALSLAAFITTSAVAGGPPNDECSSPTLISGTGTFSFDTSAATTGTEGQNTATCAINGATVIEHDVWYCWTATCTGLVTIETCGQTQVNTKMAIYRGCLCPPDGVEPVCCDDDSCGEQTQLVCDVICGEEYLIQLGSAPGSVGGVGTFTIDCAGEPCTEPCCVDFDDGTTNGFGPCPTAPNINVSVATPGPSGDPTDSYLRLRDLSGGSLACGNACTGDWTQMADGPCAAFCFDFRVFEDGCVPSIPDCAANGGWIPITPRIIISNGTVSAVFKASFDVTDDVGPNPGWVTVCAPIGLLDSSGNLPNNDDGAWIMSGGAPNSDWNSLITNVTEIRLPIDFTANPAEVAGYDNLCLRTDVCPCMELIDEDIKCDLGPDGVPTGTYTLTYTVTNYSGVDAQYILIPDPNVTPNVIPLSPPLPGDGTLSATVNVTISNATPGEQYCFDVILADEAVEECCSSNLCIELPDCECMLFDNVTVECDPTGVGGVILNFDVTNLTPDIIEHMFLIPQPVGTSTTITPDYVDVPTMNPFTTQSFGPFTISGAMPGEVLCIRITIHNEDLAECCAQDLCFTVPDCPTFDPCDLNQSGAVDVFDLFIVLNNWGPCGPDPCIGDANNDGTVDIFDLFVVLGNWS